MKKSSLREKKFQISDPVEYYFECISSCDIKDKNCISMCVEMLREYDN
jgi:hypothetical protein